MKIDLYPHQREAVDKLRTGSILLGGVGSGKSRTSLAYFFTKVCGGTLDLGSRTFDTMLTTPKDLYIITTARKRDTLEWENECLIFHLGRDPEISIGHVKVTVDSWNNIAKYENVKDAFFIFDEQRVVGYGKWSKCFIKISRSNDWILLTATPGDTWLDYIPVFIANGFYKNKTDFYHQHVVESGYSKYRKVERYLGVQRLERLRKEISVEMPFARPTTQHHEKTEVPYNRDLYLQCMRHRWNPYKNEPVQDAGGMCYVLRQVVNTDISRFDRVRDLMEIKKKAIIFYNFNYELDILRQLKSEFTVAEWNGQQHDPLPTGDCWAYLVQYTAGAEGWNCITTDTIIFYSQSYSYKAMVQAAGRIDRMNTPYTDLYYYHLQSRAPIDRAIEMALKNKKNFNEKAFLGF